MMCYYLNVHFKGQRVNYAAICLDYIASMIKRMTIQHRSNDTDRVQPKYSEEPFPSATLSTTNPTWTGLELDPVLSDVKGLTEYGGVISLLSLTA